MSGLLTLKPVLTTRTIGKRVGMLTAALILVLVSCDSGATVPTEEIPASIAIVSGTGQQAAVGAELPAPLVVRVEDIAGRPVPDWIVSWRVMLGGGAMQSSETRSDASGYARQRWTLGGEPGVQEAEAEAVTGASAPLTSGTFTAVALSTDSPPPPPVASVTVSPSTATLQVGSTTQLTAIPRDADGNPLSGRDVVWSSGNAGTATVNSSGVVTGVLAGNVTITATSEDRSGSAAVTVTEGSTSGGLLFRSDWSTATGTSVSALTDGGKWNRTWGGESQARVMSVVGGNPVGWTRTENVLRMQQLDETQDGLIEVVDFVPHSTSHWGRVYWRNDETTTYHNHPFNYNMVGSIQIIPWASTGFSDGHHVRIAAPVGYPFDLWFVRDPNAPQQRRRLPNGTWFRYEWHIEYVTTNSVRIWPRIYSMAGDLLYTAADYIQNDYGSAGNQTLESWYAAGNSFPIDAALMRNFGIGQEGPAGAQNSGQYWYKADLAFSLDGWIGAQ